MARSEVRDLIQDIGLLPSNEKLDFQTRVNLILGELWPPQATAVQMGAQDELRSQPKERLQARVKKNRVRMN